MKSLRVLHIEDSERDHELLKRHLTVARVDLTTERVDTAAGMKSALQDRKWDVVICDYSLPSFSAPEAVRLLAEMEFDIPFIIISGTVGEEEAVRALKNGANDYLMKDSLTRLVPAIDREIEDAENRRARREAEESLRSSVAELRALFAAINDVLLVIGRDGRHLKLASASPDDPLKPGAEFVGRTLWEVYDPETADRMLRHIHRALDQGRTEQIEYSVRRNERELWYEGRLSPVSEDSVILVARDITKRKKAKERIADNERQLAEAQSLARVGSWSWDLRN